MFAGVPLEIWRFWKLAELAEENETRWKGKFYLSVT
jgi:hypothetical protein